MKLATSQRDVNVAERGRLSASLEHLETSAALLFAPTRAQLRHHRPFLAERRRVMTAFHLDGSDALRKRAQRIEQCCSFPLMAMKPSGKVGVCLGLCRDRMCPLCVSRLSQKKVERVRAIIDTFDSPRFATLTVKHSERPLSSQVDHLLASFKKLRNTKEWKERVKSGVATIEVKFSHNSGMWHVHLHTVIDGDYFDQSLLSKLWEEATGDSRIVDIRAVHSRKAASNYIGKYITKPASAIDLSYERIAEFALSMAGRRTLIAFGGAHKLGKELASSEEKPERAVVIGSFAALQKKANAGCRFAGHAVDILSRMGRIVRFSLGKDVAEFGSPRVPVEEWEERLAVRLAIRALEIEFIDPYEECKDVMSDLASRVSEKKRLKWTQLCLENLGPVV